MDHYKYTFKTWCFKFTQMNSSIAVEINAILIKCIFPSQLIAQGYKEENCFI